MSKRFPTPSQIAECGGPCNTQGREACDCGLKDYEPSTKPLMMPQLNKRQLQTEIFQTEITDDQS